MIDLRTSLTLLAAPYDLEEVALHSGAPITLAAEPGDDSVPRISILAYSGGSMVPSMINQAGRKAPPYPVVVDLDGVQAEAEQIPVLMGHDHKAVVGHGRVTITSEGVRLEGQVSGAGAAADEFLRAARAGFPWQASIGARVLKADLVKRGETARVNGRAFQGPVIIARKTVIFEISTLALGADNRSAARLAAQRGLPMTFEQWLEQFDLKAEALTDDQRDKLTTAWKIDTGVLVASKPAGKPDDDLDKDRLIGEIRAEYAAEEKRIHAIRDLCGPENADIAGKAIEAGWAPERCELELLRASRPSVSGIHPRRGSAGDAVNTAVLEAATLLSLGRGEKFVLEAYGEQTINQAERFRGIGLRDLCMMCARNDGADLPSVFGNGDLVIEAATTTRSLASVVSNVVGKVAMDVYQAHEIIGLQIARTRPVPDFKQVERYRLNGSGRWEQVGKDGKLKGGILDDTKYTNQADTYGQVIGIDRKDIINDDLGILNDIGTLMGQSGAALIDDIVFTLLLANTGNFFHSNNNNLLTGGGSAFGLSGLSNARQAFRKLKSGPGGKDKDKRPIQVSPRLLLVPPELETEAEALLNSTSLNLTGSTDGQAPATNPWRNKYQLVVAPHLSDDFYSGSSAAAWYLFADPGMVPALELVFLNGVRSPTIRRVPPPADQLGVFYQGYFDLGVGFVDPKGAQKSAGS